MALILNYTPVVGMRLGISIEQIETITAVNNIDEILETSGLDAVMIGPYDIAGSLGVPGETDHAKVVGQPKQ